MDARDREARDEPCTELRASRRDVPRACLLGLLGTTKPLCGAVEWVSSSPWGWVIPVCSTAVLARISGTSGNNEFDFWRGGSEPCMAEQYNFCLSAEESKYCSVFASKHLASQDLQNLKPQPRCMPAQGAPQTVPKRSCHALVPPRRSHQAS